MSGNLHVYWYNPADSTLTDMNAKQENSCLVFPTNHFSDYAIVQLGSSAQTSQNLQTRSGNWPLFPSILLCCGSAAGFVLIKKRAR